MKRATRVAAAVLVLTAALAAGGCEDLPSSAVIRSELEREIPGARFSRDSHFHLGPVAMTLIKPIVRAALDADDEARLIVAGIRRVDVTTYRVESLPEEIAPHTLRRLEGRLTVNGWIPTLRDTDVADSSWVFSRLHDDGTLGALLVVELDASELTIVGVTGRLDEVLARALAEEPGELSRTLGS